MRKKSFLGVLIACAGLSSVTAQETPPPTVYELDRLIASDAQSGDHFGGIVALVGDTALVGSETKNEGSLINVGAVYMFEREGNDWTEREKLIPSDAVGGELFGSNLAVDGDTVAIAARGRHDANGNINVGGIYIYTRTAGEWVEQQVLVPDEAFAEGQFGNTLDLQGDTLIVGWPAESSLGFFSGAALVYTRSDGFWSETQRLFADNGEARDAFGIAVGVEGDTIFVGSSRADTPVGEDAGGVYVFERDGASWFQQQLLYVSEPGGFFARGLAVDGTTLVVGAELDRTAYVFELEDGLWTERQQLVPTGTFPVDFGHSLAVDGDTLVVGDLRGREGELTFRGSAHVYLRGPDEWVEEFVLHGEGLPGNEFFGDSVAVSGDVFLVGASAASLSGTTSTEGIVFVFAPFLEEDLAGPLVLDAQLSPNPVHPLGDVDLTAIVDDSSTGGANVVGAEISVDGGPFAPLAAEDGAFDSPTEDVVEGLTGLPDGDHEICLRGIDALGNVGPETCLSLVVDGRPPTVKEVELSAGMIPVGGTTTLSALACDVDTGNSPLLFTCYRIDGGKEEPMLADDGAFDSPTESASALLGPFPEPGVYEVCVLAVDVLLNISHSACTLVTVFEPAGSFLAGNTTLDAGDGQAELGFVARYRRGSLTPKGRTELRLEAPGLRFTSTEARVQRVSGSRATVGGTGTIDGRGRYGFRATVRDGDLRDGGGSDLVELRIWKLETGEVVYAARRAPSASGSVLIRD